MWVALTTALALAGIPPHECGHGPVTILLEMVAPAECDKCYTVLVPLGGVRYRESFQGPDCDCPTRVLAGRELHYTDWPECAGQPQ